MTLIIIIIMQLVLMRRATQKFGINWVTQEIKKPEPETAILSRMGIMTVNNGASVDVWEYQSKHLNCLISLQPYSLRDNSIIQINCGK